MSKGIAIAFHRASLASVDLQKESTVQIRFRCVRLFGIDFYPHTFTGHIEAIRGEYVTVKALRKIPAHWLRQLGFYIIGYPYAFLCWNLCWRWQQKQS